MGSSMGLWEVMLAMSKAQKQKRDEQAAATKSAWEMSKDRQQLEIDRQRVEAARLPYQQAKVESDAQEAERRARAAAAQARADKLALDRELLPERHAADLRNINARTGNVEQRTRTDIATEPYTLRLKGAQADTAEARLPFVAPQAEAQLGLTKASTERALREPSAGGASGGNGRGPLGMPPADRQEHEMNLRRMTFLQNKHEGLVKMQRTDPRGWAADPGWQMDLEETKKAIDSVNQSEAAILARSREREAAQQKTMEQSAPKRTYTQQENSNIVSGIVAELVARTSSLNSKDKQRKLWEAMEGISSGRVLKNLTDEQRVAVVDALEKASNAAR